MIAKQIISIVLVISFLFSIAFAKKAKAESIWDSIENWASQKIDDAEKWISDSAEDAGEWISQVAEDTSEWFSQAANDTANWLTNAWSDTSQWAEQVWKDSSAWISQAWNDSSAWVSQAWVDSSNWVSANWSQFVIWINTLTADNPYSWINDDVMAEGILAYDQYVELRKFLSGNPDVDQIHEKCKEKTARLSLLDEDIELIWNTVKAWSNENSIPFSEAMIIVLPFLDRLIVEGSAAIGEGTILSGSVVSKYLMTVLETINIKDFEMRAARINRLMSTLDELTRPLIAGDDNQNVLITKDRLYIENYTFSNGKYQILMLVSKSNEHSQAPLMNGKTITEITGAYFTDSEFSEVYSLPDIDGNSVMAVSFTGKAAEMPIIGRTTAIWQKNRNFLFFMLTDQEWSEEEYEKWLSSVNINADSKIELAVDAESDGAFKGINSYAQQYTIQREILEEKFSVPNRGHGWAAERGNNLIDNIRYVFLNKHSVLTADSNIKNGSDREIIVNDTSILKIQTKYYSDPVRGIAACFENGTYRYIDSFGQPMAIEVPADQYEAAVTYMENRIKKGEVPNIDQNDTARAKELVLKGHLTYQQAKHIAKAGTVESILYDSVNACVTTVSTFGLSATLEFAIDLWSGESFENALKDSVIAGLKAGGTSFAISVIASQLGKTKLNGVLRSGSDLLVNAIGSKASAKLLKFFKPGSNLHGAAAKSSLSKLLRGNFIVNAVTFAICSAGDVADIIQARISWKQFAKNLSITGVSIAAGGLGAKAGTWVGSMVCPGLGTALGIVIGAAAGYGGSLAAGALANLISEDDATEMLNIIQEMFPIVAEEYFITEDEVNKSVDNLQALITSDTLKRMYAFGDRSVFARQLIESAIDPVIAEREYIELPDEEAYTECVKDVLNEIYQNLEEIPDAE